MIRIDLMPRPPGNLLPAMQIKHLKAWASIRQIPCHFLNKMQSYDQDPGAMYAQPAIDSHYLPAMLHRCAPVLVRGSLPS